MIENTIKPPPDMPLVVTAMLEATIRDCWSAYVGDDGDAEAFWNFLTGTGDE